MQNSSTGSDAGESPGSYSPALAHGAPKAQQGFHLTWRYRPSTTQRPGESRHSHWSGLLPWAWPWKAWGAELEDIRRMRVVWGLQAPPSALPSSRARKGPITLKQDLLTAHNSEPSPEGWDWGGARGGRGLPLGPTFCLYLQAPPMFSSQSAWPSPGGGCSSLGSVVCSRVSRKSTEKSGPASVLQGESNTNCPEGASLTQMFRAGW